MTNYSAQTPFAKATLKDIALSAGRQQIYL
jgi:hypothetical protein